MRSLLPERKITERLELTRYELCNTGCRVSLRHSGVELDGKGEFAPPPLAWCFTIGASARRGLIQSLRWFRCFICQLFTSMCCDLVWSATLHRSYCVRTVFVSCLVSVCRVPSPHWSDIASIWLQLCQYNTLFSSRLFMCKRLCWSYYLASWCGRYSLANYGQQNLRLVDRSVDVADFGVSYLYSYK